MSSPSNPSGCYGLSWGYDSVGNRTAQSVTSGSCPTSSLGFNTNNQITTPSGFEYDAAGNLTADNQNNSYSYDAEGRMLTGDGGGVYVGACPERSRRNAFGRRIEKTAGGASLVYLFDLAGREIAEVNTSGANAQGDVYAGSRHLVMYANNTTSFFHTDQLGTERVRTTVTGTTDETCTSLPYGDNQTCTTGAPLGRFAGYERDNEYGLAHAPARYYSPTMGRFLSPDPFGTLPEEPSTCSLGGPPAGKMTDTLARPGSFNRYAYVNDSPAATTDRSGALAGPPLIGEGGGGDCCDPVLDPFCEDCGDCCDPIWDPTCADCGRQSLGARKGFGGANRRCVVGIRSATVHSMGTLCNPGETFVQEWSCPAGCSAGDCEAGQDSYQLECDKRGQKYGASCSKGFFFNSKGPVYYCDCCKQK